MKNLKIESADITLTFAERQTAETEFSHWEFSNEELIKRTAKAVKDGFVKEGYREGVILVHIEPEGLFSGITTLTEETPLEAKYEARQNGEEPRISFYATGNKTAAKHAYVVLYHAKVLEESGDRTGDTDWEIISVNASQFTEEPPIQPTALIYNHLELNGGTSTKMTDEEFVKLLRESMAFWKDKALTKPKLAFSVGDVVVPLKDVDFIDGTKHFKDTEYVVSKEDLSYYIVNQKNYKLAYPKD